MKFKCPHCSETFDYEPAPEVARRIRDLESKSHLPCEILTRCAHCPELLLLRQARREAELVTKDQAEKLKYHPGVIWDMVFTETIDHVVLNLRNEADQAAHANNLVSAIAKLRSAITVRKHEPDVWHDLGVYLLSNQNLPEAEAAFRHALRFNDQLHQTWSNLGIVLALQGKPVDALSSVEEALKIEPNDTKSLLNAASIHAQLGNRIMAIKKCKRALEIEPTYNKAKILLAQIEGT